MVSLISMQKKRGEGDMGKFTINKQVIERQLNYAFERMMTEHMDAVIEEAKKQLENKMRDNISRVAIDVQRHFLVTENNEHVVIEIRGKL